MSLGLSCFRKTKCRELQEEDASLERAAAEGRKNLLAAVQETADSLGKFQRRQVGAGVKGTGT